jgi:hypothetical protein
VQALWHVSEDPGIERFEPRDGLVWAIEERHLSKYWFPRDCPRGTWWAGAGTVQPDVDRFLSGDRAREVHAIQADWLDRFRAARLWAYRLPPESFEPRDDPAFYFTSQLALEPLERKELGDLFALHSRAGIELRIVPDLAAIWAQVIVSSVEFSGNRLSNL